ncbi:MAG TPA: proline--tRNA ligase [Acidimicrobiales bacterium]|nr:proline--tRNA ligase [Acidimicrobiales bacterium]
MAKVLTAQADDFPRWYQDVLSKAQLAENGPVRGTMVIRPYGYAIWERIQAEVDARIKAAGADNAYFPLFIPESYLQREADHVEGFSPELAVVTHAGGKALDEPIVVRPTSETVIGEYMGRWIQSYRDLPLLLNAWNNVVRWELRPRLFLRTTEFLWQEGHTAHATRADAAAYATRILRDVYEDFMVNVLALPVLVGRKTAAERFAGAINTMTLEGMMRDGKALQMGTSHELGQNFAKVFDITYLDAEGATQHCWTTSWGSTTRMIGGLIMTHGDDDGLVVPPRLAAVQAVVLLVKDDRDAGEHAAALARELGDAGVRVRLDDQVATSFGRRATDWELKGVPVRLEVGPRDLAGGNITLVRRDTGEKRPVPVGAAVTEAAGLLERVQADMLAAATARREAATRDVAGLDEAVEAAQVGFARLPWGLLQGEGEARLAGQGITVRCLMGRDGSLPVDDDDPDLVAVVARAY